MALPWPPLLCRSCKAAAAAHFSFLRPGTLPQKPPGSSPSMDHLHDKWQFLRHAGISLLTWWIAHPAGMLSWLCPSEDRSERWSGGDALIPPGAEEWAEGFWWQWRADRVTPLWVLGTGSQPQGHRPWFSRGADIAGGPAHTAQEVPAGITFVGRSRAGKGRCCHFKGAGTRRPLRPRPAPHHALASRAPAAPRAPRPRALIGLAPRRRTVNMARVRRGGRGAAGPNRRRPCWGRSPRRGQWDASLLAAALPERGGCEEPGGAAASAAWGARVGEGGWPRAPGPAHPASTADGPSRAPPPRRGTGDSLRARSGAEHGGHRSRAARKGSRPACRGSILRAVPEVGAHGTAPALLRA